MPCDSPALPGRQPLEDAERLLEEALAILDQWEALLPAAHTANALECLREILKMAQHKPH